MILKDLLMMIVKSINYQHIFANAGYISLAYGSYRKKKTEKS